MLSILCIGFVDYTRGVKWYFMPTLSILCIGFVIVRFVWHRIMDGAYFQFFVLDSEFAAVAKASFPISFQFFVLDSKLHTPQ